MTWMVLALAGCGGGGPTLTAADVSPGPIELAECAVCGMVVGEQPAPRGQLVYRDGTHAFLCSLEETRALARSPGPRGNPVATWVEVLDVEHDWTATEVRPHPWAAAEDAWFVFGAERPRVMGVPVLTYTDRESATTVAHALGTRPVRWDAVLATPIPHPPPEAIPTGPDSPLEDP